MRTSVPNTITDSMIVAKLKRDHHDLYTRLVRELEQGCRPILTDYSLMPAIVEECCKYFDIPLYQFVQRSRSPRLTDIGRIIATVLYLLYHPERIIYNITLPRNTHFNGYVSLLLNNHARKVEFARTFARGTREYQKEIDELCNIIKAKFVNGEVLQENSR